MAFESGHALLIGVGSYQYVPHLNVPVTAADARAMAEVLHNPSLCGYPPEHVTLLHDASATRDSILTALDQLAGRVQPDDTVLLFYCGHGDYGDDGTYYLTTNDTRVTNNKVSSRSGVSQQELLGKLKAVRAKRAVLIFNACHSGEVSPTLSTDDALAGSPLPNTTSAALLATGEGRIIITACREEQYSHIGDGELTIFTQAVVDGLHGKGVLSQRGYISAFDLYTTVYETVSDMVRTRYQRQQDPELTILKGVGSLAIALYRGATTLGTFDTTVAPPVGTAMREVSREQSERLYQQIQSGGINFGQQNQVDITGDVVAGSKIDAQGAQSVINQPTGSVTQQFGPQRTIDTGGGDYAERDIDKRQGAFVTGGTVYGAVVGTNSGNITGNYGTNPLEGGDTTRISMEYGLACIRRAAENARQHGNDDLGDDLQGVVVPLEAALKAEQVGKLERRSAKLAEARQMMTRLATGEPALQGLAQLLDTLVKT
jgi:hypothetical protein